MHIINPIERERGKVILMSRTWGIKEKQHYYESLNKNPNKNNRKNKQRPKPNKQKIIISHRDKGRDNTEQTIIKHWRLHSEPRNEIQSKVMELLYSQTVQQQSCPGKTSLH